MFNCYDLDQTFFAHGSLPYSLNWSQQINQDGMSGSFDIRIDQGGNVELTGTFTPLKDDPWAIGCAIQDACGDSHVFGHEVTAAVDNDGATPLQTTSRKGQTVLAALIFRALEFHQKFQCLAKRNGTVKGLAIDAYRKVHIFPWDREPDLDWLLQ